MWICHLYLGFHDGQASSLETFLDITGSRKEDQIIIIILTNLTLIADRQKKGGKKDYAAGVWRAGLDGLVWRC